MYSNFYDLNLSNILSYSTALLQKYVDLFSLKSKKYSKNSILLRREDMKLLLYTVVIIEELLTME